MHGLMPVRLGGPSRALAAVLHRPASSAPLALSKRAVLMCPPFGQEAVRSHRLFRVLAERLARRGHWVLRFDYFGTGDSDGDDLDADLEGWRTDVLTASAWLDEQAQRRHQVWLGARLGATAALLAAARATAMEAPHVIAWAPVRDGSGYLRDLQAAHLEALHSSYSLPDPRWRASTLAADTAALTEVMGFAVSDRWVAQVGALQPQCVPASLPGGVTWIDGPDAPPFDWTTEEAINGALVPAAVLERLMRAVEAC